MKGAEIATEMANEMKKMTDPQIAVYLSDKESNLEVIKEMYLQSVGIKM